jgi:hypothetical protein
VGAQANGTVVGLVTDSEGRPLSNVLVFVDDGAAATLTDSLGMFALSGLTAERHALGYRSGGYAPRSFALELSPGVNFRDVGTVVLQPGPEPNAGLTGRVTEGEDGPGLAGATVALNGRVVAVTDSTGAFSAPGSAVLWGTNELTIEHRAFSDRTVRDRVWVSNPSETFDFVVALGIVPVPVPGVDVPVISQRLADEGFYERREQYRSATFITREEILERNPRTMEDLYKRALNGAGMSRSNRSATGADPRTGAPTAATTFGRAEDGRPCVPLFFLNGLRLGNAPSLNPEDVEAVEIYESIARIPAQFSPVGAVCGVIVIWTRAGN